MARNILAVILVVSLLLLAGCADGPNPTVGKPTEEGKLAGFWLGLWHGFISPVTFIISLFSKTVRMYEVHNNGGWYNFGFLLGMMIILGGGGRGSAGRRRR